MDRRVSGRMSVRRPRATPGRLRAGLLPALVLALVAGGAAAGCQDRAPSLETRTFRLQYLRPDEAAKIVEPYVYAGRKDAPGSISTFRDGLTIRETPENVARIDSVLSRYDRPVPNLRLRFQLIEADGAGKPDPRIASLDSLLRGLFRYQGYRLLDQAEVTAASGGMSSAKLLVDGRSISLNVWLDRVRRVGGGGEADLRVDLESHAFGQILATSLTVPIGKTVVLGSGRPDPERGAFIVAVKPEAIVGGAVGAGWRGATGSASSDSPG